jgi:IS605 OrfB family transposase
VKGPYARRLCLTTCYGFKIRDGELSLPIHVREHVRISKSVVEEAKAKQYGIAMEKLTGIRRLYRRGNGQGRWYRGRMNSWSYAELQRQIEYKAKWEGLPVIYVHPHGTSSRCSICGERMKPEENRMLRCSSCGHAVDRDVNAAKNILAAGTLRFGIVGLAHEAMVAEPASVRQSAKSMRGS